MAANHTARESNSTEAEVVAELREATDRTVHSCPPWLHGILTKAIALIESQRATIERVERERDGAEARIAKLRDGMEEAVKAATAAEARVTALEAEKAELQAALGPFAEWEPFGVHISALARSDAHLTDEFPSHRNPPSVGDLRRARQALAQPSTQENDNG